MGRGERSCYTVTIAYCGNGSAGTLAGTGCYKHSDGGAHVFTRSYSVCEESPDDLTYISPDIPQTDSGGGGTVSPLNPIVTEPILVFSERHFVRSLTSAQLSWWNDEANDETKQDILNYLRQNQTVEGEEFALSLVDFAIEHDIEFIDNYQDEYNTFNNLSEVEDYLTYEEVDNTISNSINYEQDKKLCNKTVKLNPLVNLVIELVITPNLNFSLDQVNSKTDIDAILPGNGWVQQSITVTNSDLNGDNNRAEITISGYILVGINIGDFNKGIKIRKHIIIRVDKNDGRIFYSEVKNIN